MKFKANDVWKSFFLISFGSWHVTCGLLSGWPVRWNIRLQTLGCALKTIEVAEIFGRIFSTLTAMYYWFRQKNSLGYILGEFFYKCIWSPSLLYKIRATLNILHHGCQVVYFQTKNPNLGKFWTALEWKMLVYFTAIWYILWSFGIFHGHLVYFMAIW
jgi:hypothetical protein